jgi:hypothetical protein
MLTNFDLEHLCEQYHVPLLGVYMKDELPKKTQNGNFIIKLQSSSQGDGTHWTALIVEKNNALFMDPFGVEPSQEIIAVLARRTAQRTDALSDLRGRAWFELHRPSNRCRARTWPLLCALSARSARMASFPRGAQHLLLHLLRMNAS